MVGFKEDKMADLLKQNMYSEDFNFQFNKNMQTILNNCVGSAELIEVPDGALLILKISVHKLMVKGVTQIVKEAKFEKIKKTANNG
jgi:hypothetical protein